MPGGDRTGSSGGGKVAFSSAGEDLKSALDSRFGRAPKFLIYDLDQNDFQIIDNQQNLNALQGAGVQAAELVAKTGVQAVVTGHCGPKAYRVLSESGIKVYTSEVVSIAEALAALQQGKLTCLEAPDVGGHWV